VEGGERPQAERYGWEGNLVYNGAGRSQDPAANHRADGDREPERQSKDATEMGPLKLRSERCRGSHDGSPSFEAATLPEGRQWVESGHSRLRVGGSRTVGSAPLIHLAGATVALRRFFANAKGRRTCERDARAAVGKRLPEGTPAPRHPLNLRGIGKNQRFCKEYPDA
jgi:hypothetical protein